MSTGELAPDGHAGVEAQHWSYFMVRTQDGLRDLELEMAGNGTWQRRLMYRGKGQHRLKPEANHDAEGGAWGRLRPAERTLVVSYRGTPIYAGIIWDATYERDTGLVVLDHEDIWSLLRRRFAVPQHHADGTDTSVIDTEVTYSGLSLETQAKRVVQLGERGPRAGTAQYALPIVYDEDQTGTYEFTHSTRDFKSVDQALLEITELEGAPSFDFRPYWVTGGLRWRMEPVYEVTDTSETLLLDYSAEDTPVTDLKYRRNASEYFTEIHGTARNAAGDTIHRRRWQSSSLGEHGVALAMQESLPDVEAGADLQRAVNGIFTERRSAIALTELRVKLGDDGVHLHPGLGMGNGLRMGMRVILRGHGDPVLPDGDLERVLIGFSSAGPHHARLELAPRHVSPDPLDEG